MQYEYTVLFEPTEDGGYNVVVLAIRCYIASAKELGEEIPVDSVKKESVSLD